VILWLGGELNFIAFISLLATVVIDIMFQIVSPSKDLFDPLYHIYLYHFILFYFVLESILLSSSNCA
jgi:hypothetical protein